MNVVNFKSEFMSPGGPFWVSHYVWVRLKTFVMSVDLMAKTRVKLKIRDRDYNIETFVFIARKLGRDE